MECSIKDMGCIRAYKFRLSPDKKRQEAIDHSILLSQRLYNKLLEKAIDACKKNPNSKVSQKTINGFLNEITKEGKDYLQLYSHVRIDIRNRLLKTYQNFFRRCKQKKTGAKIKVGFPRFKSRGRFNSITYIENNGSFNIEKDRKKDMLRISKIGRVQIEVHRKIDGKIKMMTIKREAGKYYAIFTTITDIKISERENTNPVGIDLGLNSFVTFSDGTKIKKPKFMVERKRKLVKWQKIVAKRKKGSHRREKAKMHLQREWESITNQSNDFAHKLSDRLVNSGYISFAVEDLHIPNIVKNHRLAGAIHNASWNRFVQMLSYKAGSAGCKVVGVNPRDTSKTCSECGNVQDMPLSERTFNCQRCGMSKDRDLNASINILKRATLGQRGSNAQGDIDQYTPTGNASHVEELRTYPANAVHVTAGEANDL